MAAKVRENMSSSAFRPCMATNELGNMNRARWPEPASNVEAVKKDPARKIGDCRFSVRYLQIVYTGAQGFSKSAAWAEATPNVFRPPA